jgi:hypothetical protein
MMISDYYREEEIQSAKKKMGECHGRGGEFWSVRLKINSRVSDLS